MPEFYYPLIVLVFLALTALLQEPPTLRLRCALYWFTCICLSAILGYTDSCLRLPRVVFAACWVIVGLLAGAITNGFLYPRNIVLNVDLDDDEVEPAVHQPLQRPVVGNRADERGGDPSGPATLNIPSASLLD